MVVYLRQFIFSSSSLGSFSWESLPPTFHFETIFPRQCISDDSSPAGCLRQFIPYRLSPTIYSRQFILRKFTTDKSFQDSFSPTVFLRQFLSDSSRLANWSQDILLQTVHIRHFISELLVIKYLEIRSVRDKFLETNCWK
jgi:hypothetical protein